MTATARPAPAPASWPRLVLAQGLFEARSVVRHGEQVLLSLILPALFLVVLTRTQFLTLPGDATRIDLLAPGILAVAVLSSAFTGPAIGTGFDRRAGALRFLATTPLGRPGLLAGKMVGVALVQAGQMVALGAVAAALGWRPTGHGILLALPVLALGSVACTALALLVAGTLRAEAVLAGANLVWVLAVLGGGLVVPSGWWWLPTAALGDGLRSALWEFDAGALGVSLAVLAGWTMVVGAAAMRWFRWT